MIDKDSSSLVNPDKIIAKDSRNLTKPDKMIDKDKMNLVSPFDKLIPLYYGTSLIKIFGSRKRNTT